MWIIIRNTTRPLFFLISRSIQNIRTATLYYKAIIVCTVENVKKRMVTFFLFVNIKYVSIIILKLLTKFEDFTQLR